jgi:hypothetical protein
MMMLMMKVINRLRKNRRVLQQIIGRENKRELKLQLCYIHLLSFCLLVAVYRHRYISIFLI